jgi:hypothetical protein
MSVDFSGYSDFTTHLIWDVMPLDSLGRDFQDNLDFLLNSKILNNIEKENKN